MSSSRVSSPADLRQMIQDIKEVALGHTEGQILSALRECGMDPDQAAAMLLDGAEMMDSDDDSDAHATEQGSGSFELETPTSVVLDEGTVVVKNDIEGPLGAAIVKESTEVLHTKEGVTTIAQLCMNYMTDQSTETLPDVPGFNQSFKAVMKCGCGLDSVLQINNNARHFSDNQVLVCEVCQSQITIKVELRDSPSI